MTEKEMKKLSRVELLEMLVELSKKNDSLIAQNAELQQKLSQKEITVTNAGSLAEACLQLNSVFEAAQAAADQYLLNIQKKEESCERQQNEARNRAAEIILNAESKAAAMIDDAKQQADAYKQEIDKSIVI